MQSATSRKERVQETKFHGYTQITFENVVRQGLPHPSSQTRFVLQNTAFRDVHLLSAISQKGISCETSLKNVEDVKTKLSCETSRKKSKLKCENGAFVRDFPLDQKVGPLRSDSTARKFYSKEVSQQRSPTARRLTQQRSLTQQN